ncbi:hypothetical protein [Streptomyces sp. NPDC001741]|uniref:hypothetical protein n=1 Tax=Streptomyces sp. NPDC001741 TaxID=3364605 RepID=UPI0036BC88DE
MLWHAIAPSRGYTKAANELVRNQRLSSDAKILLLYVQGLPADRRGAALSEHARALGITGRAYQKAKKLLVVHGFLYEWRQQGGRGFWTTEQLLANVVLSPDEAREAREARDAPEARAVQDGSPVPVVVPPGERNPTVGQPGVRVVGGYEPVDEEREKNSSRPPTEPDSPEADIPETDLPEADLPAAEPEAAEAERVLLSLRHVHRSLHLGVAEARKLVKLAVLWLRRGVTAAEMRRVLTSDLPVDGVRSAIGFLRHRLVQKLPEGPPGPSVTEAAVPAPRLPVAAVPLAVCTGPGEEHVFRPEPGEDGEDGKDGETQCGPCRRDAAWAAWSEARSAQLAAEAAAQAADDSDPYARIPWRERFAAVRAAEAGTAPDAGVPGR